MRSFLSLLAVLAATTGCDSASTGNDTEPRDLGLRDASIFDLDQGVVRPPDPTQDSAPPDAEPVEADAAPTGACEAGETRPCADGCGVETCEDGAFGACAPGVELCNGIDDDCDTEIDENYPGLNVGCTSVQGPCSVQGVQRCAPDGQGLVCVADPVTPKPESCDGLDNDCDTEVDEDFPNQVCCTVDVHCPPSERCDQGTCVPRDDVINPGDPGGGAGCAAAVNLPSFGAYPGNTQAGAAEQFGSCSLSSILNAEVVYRFQVAETQEIQLDTLGSMVDTVIYVRTDCLDPFTEVACDKDSGDGFIVPRLRMTAQAGVTYYAIVDGGMLAGGPFVLNFQPADGPLPPECYSDDDCGWFDYCVGGQCVGEDEVECFEDWECSGRDLCVGHECVSQDECAVDRDCGADEICELGQCVAAPECSVNGDCGADERCVGGICVAECSVNADCGVDERCQAGRCVAECSVNADCGVDERCQAGRCVAECSVNADCGVDERCQAGRCVPECSVDTDCGADLVCEAGRCVAGPECLADVDCAVEQICLNDACVVGCRVDSDCGPSELCEANACVPVVVTHCDAALTLPSFGTYESSTVGQANENATTTCQRNATGGERVFAYQATRTERLEVDTSGSAFDTVVAIRTACADANSEVACDDDGGDGTQSKVSWDAQAGQTYYIVVDGYNGTSGSVRLALGVPAPEVLAACVGATAISAVGTFSGTTVGATDTFTPPAGCSLEASTAPDKVFVLRFPQSARLVLDTTGSAYDTVIAAFSACTSESALSCDDDGATAPLASQLTLDVEANRTYYVVVTGYRAAAGAFTLNVALAP